MYSFQRLDEFRSNKIELKRRELRIWLRIELRIAVVNTVDSPAPFKGGEIDSDIKRKGKIVIFGGICTVFLHRDKTRC